METSIYEQEYKILRQLYKGEISKSQAREMLEILIPDIEEELRVAEELFRSRMTH